MSRDAYIAGVKKFWLWRPPPLCMGVGAKWTVRILCSGPEWWIKRPTVVALVKTVCAWK